MLAILDHMVSNIVEFRMENNLTEKLQINCLIN